MSVLPPVEAVHPNFTVGLMAGSVACNTCVPSMLTVTLGARSVEGSTTMCTRRDTLLRPPLVRSTALSTWSGLGATAPAR